MAFEKIKENAQDLQDHTKEYIDNTIAYYKLWSFKVIMKSTTLLLKIFLLSVLLAMVLIFFSIAAALAIGYGLGNFALGFFIVGLFYLIICIIIYFIKDKIVEGPLLEKFSDFFFND